MDNTFINEELNEFLDSIIEDEEGEELGDRKPKRLTSKQVAAIRMKEKENEEIARELHGRGYSVSRYWSPGGKKTASQKAKARKTASKDKLTAKLELIIPRGNTSRKVWLQRVRRKQASIAKAKAAKKGAKNENFDLDDFLNEIINI